MARTKRTAGGGKLLAPALVLLWLAVGLAYYYAFHRPFTPQLALRAALAARDLLLTGLLFAAGGGLGARLLPQLPAAPLARLAARAAAGLGALGLLYLLAGSLSTASWLAWLLLAGVLAFVRGDLRLWWRDAADFTRLWQASGRLGRVLGWLSALVFAAGLLLALAPPLSFDGLVYHLSLPKMYLAAGQVGYVPELMYWGFPQLVHMLMTWAGALGAAHGALVAWGMGLLAVVGLLGHVAGRLGPRRGWVAAAALLCGSSLAAALSSAYVDWPGLLMGWGVLLLLDLWVQRGEARWAVWAGVFCGLAFGAKYTAGILAPLGAAVFLLAGRRDWGGLLRYLGAALLLALPWLVRNALFTGNPFYPLLIPGGEMDAIRLAYYQAGPQGSWLDAALLPLRATWLGLEGGQIGSAPGYETSLGPLLLALGGLAWLPAGETAAARKFKRVAAVLALGGLLIWAGAGRMAAHLVRSHLYFAIFPAFAALAAFGFAASERLRFGAARLGRIVAAVACLALGLNTLQSAVRVADTGVLPLWSGAQSEQQFAERNLGLYAAAMAELPSDGRTLMLWETRGFPCLPACEPDEIIDRWVHDRRVYGSAQATLDAWRAAGFKYVLYYRLGAHFVHGDPQHYYEFDLDELEAALGELPVMRNLNDDYILFELQ